MLFQRSIAARRAMLLAATASAALMPVFWPLSAKAADEKRSPILIPELVISAPEEEGDVSETVKVDEIAGPPARDAGELLSRLPGVTAGRMGGHGSDISIRGMSEDRIAVLSDGAYVFGACPNRMDPPTSSMMPMSGDSITVRRGYQSVLDGPPAPAGTVSLERADPADFPEGLSGNIEAGVESNGSQRYVSAQARAVERGSYIRGFVTDRRADNYEDGSGREVRSAFEQYGGGGEVGLRYGSNSLLSFSAEQNRAVDVYFAGAGMDAPWTATDTYRLAIEHNFEEGGAFKGVEASVYGSFVDHVMDNYSLRTPGTMTMRTDATSDTRGARLAGVLEFGNLDVTIGGDYRRNDRDAISYSSMMAAIPPATISNYTWPGMEIEDAGLFVEASAPLTARTDITAGIRTDFVSVKATKADLLPGGMGAVSARTLYNTFYGVVQTDRDETNVSGLVRVTHDFGGFSGWAGASRAVRTADATERGIARAPAMGGGGWVGNPGIDPEQHHQVDMGIETAGSAWKASTGIWYDNVKDFISRDIARGQSGVLVNDGISSIFRNVDAELAGVDVAGQWAFAPSWHVGGNLAYTYGENTTDNRALYQISPISGSVELVYDVTEWSAGTRMRWAGKQTRADTSTATGSGLDVRETPGYAVFDLFGTWQLASAVELRGGVANLLDTTYASHLSRGNGFDPAVVQVNEPGRSAYLQMNLTF
ncbi:MULTISPECIES: TonB-dependent receptor domain-containing protein [Pseudomonadota]|uniref:TonB-dependent receptor domain-containing protein n=1 Tax=Pseudomonadota TaxID=1224 RepID=UPI00272EFC8D|nr:MULTISPECIES: TonB-dependent receptor [Pseudomonadota]MDP1627643.1 TonB-dependent receptor [Parvibaculum sp.]MDP2243745.1 TonB-dependent receptor [Pseudomonas sp.]MDP3329073.1 TonB-dependent receptor [Parvibaculum sp.]